MTQDEQPPNELSSANHMSGVSYARKEQRDDAGKNTEQHNLQHREHLRKTCQIYGEEKLEWAY